MAERPTAPLALGLSRISAVAEARVFAPHSARLYRATLFDLGALLARIFPLALLRPFAGLTGWLYAVMHPRRVEIVCHNLQLLDPSLGQTAARRVYAEFGKTLADYFHIGTRSDKRAMHLVGEIDGDDHLRAAQELGKGALIVTAHFGLFELGGLLLAWQGFDALVLTYPEPSAALSRWRAGFRARWKAGTLEVGADSFAFLQIAECLRQGKFIASLIDRPHPTDSVPVTLPHGRALFSTGVLLLAEHTGAPVIPATMVRRDDGSYHAQIFPPIFVTSRGSRADTLGFYSQQIADTLTPVLCAYPEQWYQFVPVAAPDA
jgi:Kdo2-lipid IVA lauroyltransferase/acyltransferase